MRKAAWNIKFKFVYEEVVVYVFWNVKHIVQTFEHSIECIQKLQFVMKIYSMSRADWKRRPHRIADRINVFTDGSKINNQLGGGVYSAEMWIYENFRLPEHCSVYQAEVISTQAAMMHIDKMKPNMSHKSILG